MHKKAQDAILLQELRTSIVNFHQNMRIGYHKLETEAHKGYAQSALLEAFKPLLENINKTGVFGTTFTTDQLRQHLRYLEGIVKPIASRNAFEDEEVVGRHSAQPYYPSILAFGKQVKENFVPLGTGLRSTVTDEELTEYAPVLSDLLDKVGANFVTKLNSYIGSFPGAAEAMKIIDIVKLAELFRRFTT